MKVRGMGPMLPQFRRECQGWMCGAVTFQNPHSLNSVKYFCFCVRLIMIGLIDDFDLTFLPDCMKLNNNRTFINLNGDFRASTLFHEESISRRTQNSPLLPFHRSFFLHLRDSRCRFLMPWWAGFLGKDLSAAKIDFHSLKAAVSNLSEQRKGS